MAKLEQPLGIDQPQESGSYNLVSDNTFPFHLCIEQRLSEPHSIKHEQLQWVLWSYTDVKLAQMGGGSSIIYKSIHKNVSAAFYLKQFWICKIVWKYTHSGSKSLSPILWGSPVYMLFCRNKEKWSFRILNQCLERNNYVFSLLWLGST